MPNDGTEIRTRLSLKVPKEVEVPLVPLRDLENVEFRFLWFTVFLTFFGAFLGALISYASTDNFNMGGIPILLVFVSIIFLLFALIFGITAFRDRKRLKQGAEERKEDKYLELFQGLGIDLLSKHGTEPVSISDIYNSIIGLGQDYPGGKLRELLKRGMAISIQNENKQMLQIVAGQIIGDVSGSADAVKD